MQDTSRSQAAATDTRSALRSADQYTKIQVHTCCRGEYRLKDTVGNTGCKRWHLSKPRTCQCLCRIWDRLERWRRELYWWDMGCRWHRLRFISNGGNAKRRGDIDWLMMKRKCQKDIECMQNFLQMNLKCSLLDTSCIEVHQYIFHSL